MCLTGHRIEAIALFTLSRFRKLACFVRFTTSCVLQVVDSIVGTERLKRFDVILAGDDVTKKKPDPLIYNMARERLGIAADK